MKLRTALLISISILLIAAASANAAELSLTITLDRDTATLADVINLTISVEGASGEPQLPSSPAFETVRQGSSSRVQIVNGRMSSSVDYSYLLSPKKEGVFTIGPNPGQQWLPAQQQHGEHYYSKNSRQ